MKKTIIHSFDVSKVDQKVAFQMKLPLNAKKIEGIKVTSTGYSLSPRENEIGWLWLRIPQNRDVFFAHIINLEDHKFSQNSYMPELRPFGMGDAWIDGKKESFFHIECDLKNP